ncbi:MAG TPA: hypothetical protein VF212_07695 [Longimicrobiales bacterium]
MPATTVYAPVRDAVRAGAAAFRDFDVPVLWTDPVDGRVVSGRFEVEASWGGEPVTERVYCGSEDGQPRAGEGVIVLEVELKARPSRVRDGAVPVSTVPHTIPTYGRTGVAGGAGHVATRVAIASRGTLTDADGDKHGCRLTPEFAERIMQAIVLRTGGVASGR